MYSGNGKKRSSYHTQPRWTDKLNDWANMHISVGKKVGTWPLKFDLSLILWSGKEGLSETKYKSICLPI